MMTSLKAGSVTDYHSYLRLSALAGRLRRACRFIFTKSRLFGSVVRALDFNPGRPSSNPTTSRKCFLFQLCFIPLLRLSCRNNIYLESLVILKKDRANYCPRIRKFIVVAHNNYYIDEYRTCIKRK